MRGWRLMRGWQTILLLLGLSVGAVPAHAQLAGRLVEAVDSSARGDHIDINILFNCGLRYVGHAPASEGDTLRLRFTPLADCGDLNGSLSTPPLDGVEAVRSIEAEQITLGEVDVTLRFAASERYILAPSGDAHGVRVRLLRPASSGARVVVLEKGGRPAGYAINLDVAREPFDEPAIAAATRATGSPAYVSEYSLGGETWYRLRIGPFDTEKGARQVLLAVRASYPKAWLAIGDDATLNADDSTAVAIPAPTRSGPTPTLTPAEIEATFRTAKAAFGRKDYAAAIPLLTRLLEQPEHPRRAEAQELIGLARERHRQIAHAKAEYEEYLSHYPEGPAAQRVRERLRALRLAARRSIGLGGGDDEADRAWKVYGGAAQTYRRDTTQLDNAVQSTNTTSQNALFSDADFVARRRGERFNFTSRVSAGYIKDMLSDGPGDRTRVTLAFFDLADREQDWSARFGRQSRNTGGIFGTFDGLAAGKQLFQHLRIDTSFGYPVESARQGFDTSRRFAGLSLDFGTFANAWNVGLYGLAQQLAGASDRQAVGSELRYFRPGRTVVAMVDYDLHFQALNDAILLATFALPGRWTVTANIDQRKSPTLGLRNALIGQTAASFDDLLSRFSRSELEQLAVDRTADSRLYSMSIARPFGERWQWTLDYSSISTTGTPASGGVDAIPDAGSDNSVSLQGLASSLFGGNDLSALVLRHQSGATADTNSLGISTRLPLGRFWRVGPRLRVDQRHLHSDGSTQMLYSPTLRLDLVRARMLLECEVGGELGRRTVDQARESTTRYTFSLGYRLNF